MRRKRRRAAALQAQTFIFDRIVSRSFAKLSSSKFYSEEKFLVRKRVRSTTKASHAFHTSSLSALYLEDGPAFDQRVILFNSTEATNEEFLSFESKIANAKLNRSFRVGILVQVEPCLLLAVQDYTYIYIVTFKHLDVDNSINIVRSVTIPRASRLENSTVELLSTYTSRVTVPRM